MILHAPAKVNLCLFLGPPRTADGRHQLVTVLEALSLADQLELEFGAPADAVICPGVAGENLALRALAGLRGLGWSAPPVRITIDKRIPVAAGMGGGSSDAAAVLRLLDGPERPLALARSLGADVPALIDPGLWLAGGAGDEDMTRFPGGLGEHAYLVLPSAHALSTADVYREADRLGLGRSPAELAALMARARAALGDARRLPAELLVNDLAPAALSLCPSIQDGLDALAGVGADTTMVSGSGPTTVGIFWGARARERAETACATLASSVPGAATAVPFPAPSQSEPVP
ncbi:MAG TPA: hypothetical protein VFN48_02010 [Solirubrobacteraceae bacterium]|nr:hypothetical protein [Solirubrobacteraceae bacterium]